MILPFLSLSWSAYAGQYGESMVRFFCDVPNAARFAAPYLRARSKGRRAVMFQNAEMVGKLFNHPDDRLQGKYRGLWFTHGVAATATQFGGVVEQLFAAKADLDIAVFDIESVPNPFALSAGDFQAIHADPRYADLVANGQFPADCRNMDTSELRQFMFGIGSLIDNAVQAALITPLYKRYNNVAWCNYLDAPVTKADSVYTPDPNGHAFYASASSAPYYTPSLYGTVGNLADLDPRFKQPFYVLALATNSIRAVYRAKPDAKVMPWLAPRVLSNVWNTAWWIENIYHSCCLAGTNLLYFNANDLTTLSNWRFDNAIAQFIGKARGKTWKSVLTTDMVKFDSATYVCSACKLSDGSVVGRVSFKTDVDTAKFTVDGKSYTVKRPAGGIGEWFHS